MSFIILMLISFFNRFNDTFNDSSLWIMYILYTNY